MWFPYMRVQMCGLGWKKSNLFWIPLKEGSTNDPEPMNENACCQAELRHSFHLKTPRADV